MTDPRRFLTRMLVSTINAREVESHRVSRALHDEVGQVLSAVGLQLDVLKLDFESAAPEIVSRVHEIQEMLDQAMRKVRALSYDLNPAVVERAGLQFALDRLVGRHRDDFEGSLRFLFHPSVRVPLNVGNAWYKITDLAVSNAIRHAKASRIEVQVKPGIRSSYALEIRDNGSGFSMEEAKIQGNGLGLLLMQHYAQQGEVTLSIKSAPGRGTIVRTSYKLPAAANEATLGDTGNA